MEKAECAASYADSDSSLLGSHFFSERGATRQNWCGAACFVQESKFANVLNQAAQDFDDAQNAQLDLANEK